VYALVFVIYQVAALAVVLWWLVLAVQAGGGGVPGLIGAYALLVIPAGFGAALLLSLALSEMPWATLSRGPTTPLSATTFTASCLHSGTQ
jgi:hypothetical protein